jgi:hypothetical protein
MFRRIRLGHGLRPCASVDLNVWDALDIDDLPTGAELGAHLGSAEQNKARGAHHDIFLDEATEKVLARAPTLPEARCRNQNPLSILPSSIRRPHTITVARGLIRSRPAYPCDIRRCDAPSKACDSA